MSTHDVCMGKKKLFLFSLMFLVKKEDFMILMILSFNYGKMRYSAQLDDKQNRKELRSLRKTSLFRRVITISRNQYAKETSNEGSNSGQYSITLLTTHRKPEKLLVKSQKKNKSKFGSFWTHFAQVHFYWFVTVTMVTNHHANE